MSRDWNKDSRLSCASGMGLTTYTAARILKGQLQNQTGEETVMTMDTFPSVGLAKVHARTPTEFSTSLKQEIHSFLLRMICRWCVRITVRFPPLDGKYDVSQRRGSMVHFGPECNFLAAVTLLVFYGIKVYQLKNM